jgi:hypothetical protein
LAHQVRQAVGCRTGLGPSAPPVCRIARSPVAQFPGAPSRAFRPVAIVTDGRATAQRGNGTYGASGRYAGAHGALRHPEMNENRRITWSSGPFRPCRPWVLSVPVVLQALFRGSSPTVRQGIHQRKRLVSSLGDDSSRFAFCGGCPSLLRRTRPQGLAKYHTPSPVCPCSSVFVRVRPSHPLIEPAKEPISQDPPPGLEWG